MRTFPVEEIGAILARECDTLGKLAHQLHNLRYVIVVLAISRAGCGVKQVIAASEQLEDLDRRRHRVSRLLGRGRIRAMKRDDETDNTTHDASHAPNIRAGPPSRTKDDLGTSVLSCLDIVREMMLDPRRCVPKETHRSA